MNSKISFKKAASLLLEANDIAIFTHIRPDFDTVGSAKALEYALRKLGKRAKILCSDSLEERFSLICDDLSPELDFEPEFAVCVDMAAEAMLGRYREEFGKRIDLSIDHHFTNAPFAKHTLCRSDASATGELIFKICKLLGVKLDRELAAYLYCAISSDSGCFKFSNTSPVTHRIAARLLESGIDAAYLNRMMLDVRTPAQLELEKRCLETLRFYGGGLIAVMTVTNEMCKAAGAKITDVDALVQIPRTVSGVEVGIVLKQQRENESFKVSVRSNDYFDATALAAIYGGGGHKRASGFVIKGDDASVLCEQIAGEALKLL